MPRQCRTQTQTHSHSVELAPVFVCPVDSCPGKTRVLNGGMRAWTRHRRAYHLNVDFSQYGNLMRTHIPASDAPSPSLSVTSSPTSSLASVLEDDPFTMEDHTVGALTPDNRDFLLSDPPTHYSDQSQPDIDGDSQSDGIIKVHYHLMLDGTLSFFISIWPY